MSSSSNDIPADESRPSPSTSSSSTMKLPSVLRRGSAFDTKEKPKEKDLRRASITEPERRSSLPTLPIRLRRKKTQTVTEHTGEDIEAAERLGRLFFSLPSEIISQIVSHLTLANIYSLRRTSRIFNSILDYNAQNVARSILPQIMPSATVSLIQNSLYPPPAQACDLSYLMSTLRRHTLLNRHVTNLLAFVQMKIYMTRTATRILSVSDNRLRLTQAFHRPAWFVAHFLESYRDILIHQHPKHAEPSIPTGSCEECTSASRAVISTYPNEDILPAWHFYQLTLEHLQISTRAPSSAGALERKLRRWNKAHATEENLAIFVVLGGIPEVRKMAMMQGTYGSRVGFMVDFVDNVRSAVSQNEKSSPGIATISVDRDRKVRGSSVVDSLEQERNSTGVIASLSPPYSELTQEHINSLPDVTTFFYDVWKDRINECAPAEEAATDPYFWLQRTMEGSGLEFGQSRAPEPPLALGASPL